MSARGAALRALQQLEKGRIERLTAELSRLELEPRDAALARDIAQGVVRNQRFLDHVLGNFVDRHLPRDPRTLAALRMGAFQLLLQSGMPPRAAVHETVALLAREQAFANAVLRRIADAVAARPADPGRADLEVALSPTRTLVLRPPGLANAVDPLATRHSVPEFLLERWRATHGADAARRIAEASSAVPSIFLRACGGRSAESLSAELMAEGVRCVATDHPLVLRCASGAPLGTRVFAAGGFVVQDPTAVAIAEAVEAAPGMTIVDLCAAPGTKATLLAERVAPDGVVFAYDIDPSRRQRITENAQRLGLQSVLRVVDDPAAVPAADAVLADVPCSNTGVLARRVEVRRRLEPSTFAALAEQQAAILRQALGMLQRDGRAVYSTCSIEAEENDGVVDAVAARGLATVTARQLVLPAAGRCDGGFHAVLRPTGAAGVPDRSAPG